jgi:hypothetical protein
MQKVPRVHLIVQLCRAARIPRHQVVPAKSPPVGMSKYCSIGDVFSEVPKCCVVAANPIAARLMLCAAL